MHHIVFETYLIHRKLGVREFHEAYLRTYAGCYGYSHVYVGLKKNSGLDSR